MKFNIRHKKRNFKIGATDFGVVIFKYHVLFEVHKISSLAGFGISEKPLRALSDVYVNECGANQVTKVQLFY